MAWTESWILLVRAYSAAASSAPSSSVTIPVEPLRKGVVTAAVAPETLPSAKELDARDEVVSVLSSSVSAGMPRGSRPPFQTR